MSFPWNNRKKLSIEWSRCHSDGRTYISQMSFDDNPLVTEENAEVWQGYLSNILRNAVTAEALESVEFKEIAAKCRERRSVRNVRPGMLRKSGFVTSIAVSCVV